jgi:DNA repair protein RecO (recombination protein O)
MKIIVLSINQYKEKDAIITAISQSETITFLARGVKDPKSKNAALNNPLTVADIELMEGDYKYPVLKASKELFVPMKLKMDSTYLSSLLIMNEMMLHLFSDEEKYEMFTYLEEGVIGLKKTNDWLMTLLIFMAQAIRIGGFELEVNRCVICNQKNRIVAFSFIEGGFICENCVNEETERDLTKEQMILLRSIFNSRDYHLLDSSYSRDDALILFRKTLDFMQEAFGYRLKNIKLILD